MGYNDWDDIQERSLRSARANTKLGSLFEDDTLTQEEKDVADQNIYKPQIKQKDPLIDELERIRNEPRVYSPFDTSILDQYLTPKFPPQKPGQDSAVSSNKVDDAILTQKQQIIADPIRITKKFDDNDVEVSDEQIKSPLEDILNQRRQDLSSIGMAEAASDIGRSIAGAGRLSDEKASFGTARELAGQKVKEYEALQKDKDETERRDPNSDISKVTRQNIITSLRRLGNHDLADNIERKGLSAKQLEDGFGQYNLSNMLSLHESAEARKEAMRLAMVGKKEAQQEKRDDKKLMFSKALSDKINAIDKEVDYSTLATNTKLIRDRIVSGKYNGVDDVLSIYALIKAIDPGSMVKEGEVSLVFGADSALAKIGNFPKKLMKGDLASPEMRQKLIDALSRLETTRRSQYEAKISPYIKQAEKLGIPREDIDITEQLKESSFTPTPEIRKSAEEEQKRRGGGK